MGIPLVGNNIKVVRPIDEDGLELYDLPTSFSRKDLEKLKESKDAIKKDIDDYVEEHKNDERYQLTEEEKKMEAERLKRIEDAQKALNKGNKKRRL